jgi:hypothetical protein
MTNLRAGVGRADITPPAGIAHINWGARTHDVAEGIDLPLWVTVLTLETEDEKAAIVDLDMGVLPTSEVARFRGLIEAATGIPATGIRLSYTHTHAGPPWEENRFGGQSQLPGMDLVPAYRDYVTAQLVAASRQAMLTRKPARLSAGYGDSRVSVNRRLRLPEGRTVVAQNWDGYADSTVLVVRIDDADENPLAAIVGYGTHPIILAHQNKLISPDYPGVTKRVVEQLTGATCLFLQGCAGDQMPLQGLTGDVSVPRRIGTMLGAEAGKVFLGLRTKPTKRRFDRVVESGAPLGIWAEDSLADDKTRLAVVNREIKLPVRKYDPPATTQAEADRALSRVRDLDKRTATAEEIADANYKAKRASMVAHWSKVCDGAKDMTLTLQAIRLGPVGLVAGPLEPFARIGVEVRERSPLPFTQFAGYTNGWQGYVPNAEDFPIGGYETEWAGAFSPEAAGVLVGEAVRLTEVLAQR